MDVVRSNGIRSLRKLGNVAFETNTPPDKAMVLYVFGSQTEYKIIDDWLTRNVWRAIWRSIQHTHHDSTKYRYYTFDSLDAPIFGFRLAFHPDISNNRLYLEYCMHILNTAWLAPVPARAKNNEGSVQFIKDIVDWANGSNITLINLYDITRLTELPLKGRLLFSFYELKDDNQAYLTPILVFLNKDDVMLYKLAFG